MSKIKKRLLIPGMFLGICLVFILMLVFNLKLRDDVRTPVLHMAKKVQAVFKGAKTSVAVLSYHGIDTGYIGDQRWFVSPNEFDKQLKYLKDNGYTAITSKQLADFRSVQNPVAIMFDDGYSDLYTYAYPLLKKYNLKATCFIISDMVGKPFYLTVEEITAMKDVFDYESHTKTHSGLSNCPPNELTTELCVSKQEIEKIAGTPVLAIAYPGSKYNKTVLAQTAKYYKYGFLNWGGRYYGFEDPLAIPRIPIFWSDSIEEFAKKVKD